MSGLGQGSAKDCGKEEWTGVRETVDFNEGNRGLGHVLGQREGK